MYKLLNTVFVPRNCCRVCGLYWYAGILVFFFFFFLDWYVFILLRRQNIPINLSQGTHSLAGIFAFLLGRTARAFTYVGNSKHKNTTVTNFAFLTAKIASFSLVSFHVSTIHATDSTLTFDVCFLILHSRAKSFLSVGKEKRGIRR